MVPKLPIYRKEKKGTDEESLRYEYAMDVLVGFELVDVAVDIVE